MTAIGTLGSEHVDFVKWAQEQGIDIKGVSPKRFPGRGLGIEATRNIRSGETLVHVPTTLLLTTDCIPAEFRKRHASDITVHGLLASFLAFGDAASLAAHAEWRATWPTAADFQETMPLLWPQRLKEDQAPKTSDRPLKVSIDEPMRYLLPPGVAGQWSEFYRKLTVYASEAPEAANVIHESSVATKQERKLELDFQQVKNAIVDAKDNYNRYVYNWCVVNTRCFYYVPDGEEPPVNSDEAMALCPFMDYFNHSDHGCEVTFDRTGYTLKADRDYTLGEELYVSYGNHSNDFLLTEYGFILEENSHDVLMLDDIVLAALTGGSRWQARKKLADAGYCGQYSLSSSGVCFRTEVAVLMDLLPKKKWRNFIAGTWTYDDDEEPLVSRTIEGKVYRQICHYVTAYWYEAYRALEYIQSMDEAIFDANMYAKSVLLKRWNQIEQMCITFLHGWQYHDTMHYSGWEIIMMEYPALGEVYPEFRQPAKV